MNLNLKQPEFEPCDKLDQFVLPAHNTISHFFQILGIIFDIISVLSIPNRQSNTGMGRDLGD
jgi:hypothetical protein